MNDVALAIVTRNGKFLLLKRSDTDEHNAGRWALPGGHFEPGETAVDALIRELKEETNLDTIPTFCKEMTVADDDGKRLHLFWVMKTKGDVELRDGEHSEFIWCTAEGSRMYNPIIRITDIFLTIEDKGLLS